MKRTLRILLILVLITAAGIAAWWVWRNYPDRVAQVLDRFGLAGTTEEESGLLQASGIIEADKLAVTSEGGGRIVELLADEGDSVEPGQPLLRLDSALLEAQIAQAAAAVDVAEAQLALARAQARPEELGQPQALVGQAKAITEAARQAWLDAQGLRDNPQDLDVQIVVARSEVEVAGHLLAAARAEALGADLEIQFWERTVQLLQDGQDISVPIPGGSTINIHLDSPSDKLTAANLQWNLTSQRTWQVHEAEREAEEGLAAAQSALAHLIEQRQDPQLLQVQVDAAEAAFHNAEAAEQVAASGLLAVQAGASEEQIGLADAQLAQAQAALETLLAQRDKPLLRAVRGGVVVARPVHVGGIALPGSTLLEIADLDNVTLTVYVPEERLGEVHVGQEATAQVDSLPDRVFAGRVTRIADKAEYTRISALAVRDDRVQIVFAVEIALSNLDQALKPGMPADATFGGTETELGMEEQP
ncbi:MAG TPA: efflux RND transporter periplasmic adaptor subunit [Anaerolineae bacterium]|nr:efflux RND transporter periplasmic adaptor subunit [Anaerolineae bacterium]